MLRLLPCLAVALAACYETPKPNCLFLCGEGDACPDGYECSAEDDRCHLVEPGGGLAECPDPLPSIDAAPIDAPATIDAGPDAEDVDAEIPDMAETCGPLLAPTDDDTGGAPQTLVISEINPGEYIEIYNATNATIDLENVAFQLCSRPNYVSISSLVTDVSVPAFSYRELPWPAAFTDTDAGGEIVLYADSDFANAASVMDFVCWGTNPHLTRITEAMTASKWDGAAGDCPGALTMGAIHRLATTPGDDAASYDVTAAPSPMSCTGI